MIYVFDSSSLISLKYFFPGVFKSVWLGLDELVKQGKLISTKEVWREMEIDNFDQFTTKWLKERKGIFKTPTSAELMFVAEIFQDKHFHALIGEKQRLKGTPVADPFVIACAKINKGTVVTEEKAKPNAAKIPNVCQHFNIPCINLEVFMHQQEWDFLIFQNLFFLFKFVDMNFREIKDALKDKVIKPANPDSESRKLASYQPFWA